MKLLSQKFLWWLEAVSLRSLLLIFRLFGPKLASRIGGFTFRKLGPFFPPQKVICKNLSRAFPDLCEAEQKKLSKKIWYHLGATAGEFSHLPKITSDPDFVRVKGIEHFRKIDSGRPVILVSGHFANWEVMASMVAQYAYPVTFAVRETNNPYVARVIRRLRTKSRILKVLNKSAAAGRELVRAMRRGENMAVLNDQKFGTGMPISWFGQEAATNPLPAKLAMKFNAAILWYAITGWGRLNLNWNLWRRLNRGNIRMLYRFFKRSI